MSTTFFNEAILQEVLTVKRAMIVALLLTTGVVLNGCSPGEGKLLEVGSSVKDPYSSDVDYMFATFDNKEVVVGATEALPHFNMAGPINFGLSSSSSIDSSSYSVITPDGVSVYADNLTIGASSKIIWDFLKGNGLSDYAASGVLGNLESESGLRSNNLQNTAVEKLGLSDVEYTKKVDDGTYTNFTLDSAGYGLAQWTTSGRKAGLLNMAKAAGTSIADYNTQLKYLWKELSSDNYKSAMNDLKAATTVKAASNAVMIKFEAPADKLVPSKQAARAKLCQKYYDKYRK